MPSEMLDAIRELRESIPQEQREKFSSLLSEEQMAALGAMLSSTTDEKAVEKAVDRFKEVIGESPETAWKLWQELTGRQRELITEITEDRETG